MPDAIIYIIIFGAIILSALAILYIALPILQWSIQIAVSAVVLPFCYFEKKKRKKNKVASYYDEKLLKKIRSENLTYEFAKEKEMPKRNTSIRLFHWGNTNQTIK